MRVALAAWFDTEARDLPWRRPDRTAWGVLVSEVMLQQTPVSRVEPAWRDWLARWPTPAALAAADDADLIVAWGRLGYPRRALRLGHAARRIVAAHGGEVPRDSASLRSLPGIGEYTAAAVRAFAFGLRDLVLDTNVRRVIGRLVAGLRLPPPSLTSAERAAATRLLPADDAASVTWNAALMELGALVCTAGAPNCDGCPLADRCRFRAAGFPPDRFAAQRRLQPWHGTDRQLRGRVLATLRESGAVPVAQVAAEFAPLAADPHQLERCLASLQADGLIARRGDRLTLPGRSGEQAVVRPTTGAVPVR